MFLFTIVNPGSEKAIKEEVSLKYPDLRFAYSRPGFVTFKHLRPNFEIKPDTGLDLCFARNYGPCYGKYTAETLDKAIAELSAIRVIQRYSIDGSVADGPVAQLGETVLDVIAVAANEFWLGSHVHGPFRWAFAGANPRLEKPELAPSRAWLKIEEALRWTGQVLAPGTAILELGSSPGGVSFALLHRGCRVWGVDGAAMDDSCLTNPNFSHLAMEMHQVQAARLPPQVEVLVCDVNLSPDEVLPQLKRFVKLRPTISAIFYTLKIGQNLKIEAIPAYLDQLKRLGFSLVKTTQLPSNRSEILVYAQR